MAGGYDGNFLSSTEIYSTSKMEWKFGADLPSVRQFISNGGISVDNNVFLLGNKKTRSARKWYWYLDQSKLEKISSSVKKG